MLRPIGIWKREDGQGIAEYAVLLLLIVALVIGTVRLTGANVNSVFSAVADVFQSRADSD